MKNNVSVLALLIGCVILIGGLYAINNGNSGVQPKELTSDQKALLTVQPNDYAFGPKDAKVTLMEYFDYECPPCGSFYPIVKELEQKHPEVQFVFRYFPLSGHLNAMNAATAAEAAARQGKYKEMTDLLFTHQDEWGGKNAADASLFVAYAQSLGLNMEQWEKDRNSDEVKARVKQSFDTGVSAGVRGTPTFFLNGEPLQTPSSLETFSEVLTTAGLPPVTK